MPSTPIADADAGADTVSVIVPTCNRRDMLGRCLHSILTQTRPPLEIIVVNDAGAAVDDIIAAHNASGIIRHAAHASNKGASAARNTGLGMARGAYIAYLDDDDLYRPAHLETLLGALRRSDCRFGYTFADYVIDDLRDGQLVNVGRIQPYSGIAYARERLMVANFIPTPTWMFARTLLDEVGEFDEFFGACEDWEWLLRASAKTGFLTVPAHTVEVRQRLHDQQHLIVQHRPQMNKWIKAVYAKHPAGTQQLRMARHEHLAFGAAQPLGAAQEAAADAAQAGAAAGTLDLIALINMAELLAAANQRHRAVALYQAWVERNTQSPLRHAACFNLGVALQNLGQHAEAEAAYRLALRCNHAFNLARLQLAALLELRGSVDEALDTWRTVARQERGKDSAAYQQASDHLARYLTV